MLDAFFEKLKTVTSLPPTAENEVLIRNLSHSLINELRMYYQSGLSRDAEKLIKSCYSHIEILNRSLIMTNPPNNYIFAQNDLGYAVANCVIACDTLLSGSDNILTFQSPSEMKCVFSRKLITHAVTLMAEALISEKSGAFIEFRLRSLSHSVILSASADNCNQPFPLSCEFSENISVLSKIANLHSGACVWKTGELGAYIAISIGKNLMSNGKAQKPPSYIDLLLDRTSDIYVGLSRIENLLPRS